MNKFIVLYLLLLLPFTINAKGVKYPVNEIPDSLLKNADAVVRYHNISVEVESLNRITTKVTYVVTIFNKSAKNLGYFKEYYSKESSISNYSLSIYNSSGYLIKKSQRKDFTDIKAYDGFSLYDDNRLIINKAYSTQYPYTIEYSYTQTEKQTMNISSWYPVSSYNVSVENAEFNLQLYDTYQFRILVKNIPNQSNSMSTNTRKKYRWDLRNYKAIENEKFMPDFIDIVPKVKIAPNDFSYDGYDGNMFSWKSFGTWSWDLIKDRDKLPDATINEVNELVKQVDTDAEKVKLLYKYLQDNTRYVSIQLGIGGYQPFEPELVEETNYGDCKALSNYMRSLLKVADIKSNYLEIKAGDDATEVITSFPSNQFNHVILCVPNKGDSIWLECTSQRQPFGFLGSFTDDRYALEITENGGKLIKTPDYPMEVNTQFRTINATINELGNMEMTSSTNYKGLQYENVESFLYLDSDEQKKRIYKKLNLPNLTINSYDINHGGDFIPYASLDLDLSIKKYAEINGNRMFISLNPLNKQSFIPKKIKERKYTIKTTWKGYDADTIVINFPSNYNVEFLPDDIELISPYGEYKTQLTIDSNKVVYIRELKLQKGVFEADEYDDFRDFFKKIANSDNDKIVLNK